MTQYYILIEPWGVYVKEADFFISQGGLTAKWGAKWQKIDAESIEDARSKGQILQVTR